MTSRPGVKVTDRVLQVLRAVGSKVYPADTPDTPVPGLLPHEVIELVGGIVEPLAREVGELHARLSTEVTGLVARVEQLEAGDREAREWATMSHLDGFTD